MPGGGEPIDDGDAPVSTSVAASAIGVSARTLARYVEQGLLDPAVRLPSGQYRWRLARLLDDIERRQPGSPRRRSEQVNQQAAATGEKPGTR